MKTSASRIIFTWMAACLGVATLATNSPASTSVATVPVGIMEFALPHGTTTFLSFPLTKASTYSGAVATVTTNGIGVSDTPAPFTTNLATPQEPYFIKFLSGNESGRVLLITSSTAGSFTVDTTDHTTGSAVSLLAQNYSVQAGDTFEIFPGDTLASVMGSGSNASLVLTGGTSAATSDVVSLYTTVGAPPSTYYYNTTLKRWTLASSGFDGDDVIIYPYSAFTVTRRLTHPDTQLVLLGRVTPVAAATKTVSHESVYTSSHYAVDVKLSQLNFGANWQTGNTAALADTISVWNPTLKRFELFYQRPDLTWRKQGNAVTDQSNFVIAAGTVTAIANHRAVAGGSSFLVTDLPYSLD